MLVLLPPSETKATGGDGPPLDLGALAAAEPLTPVRERLLDALDRLARKPELEREALGLSPRQSAPENAELRTAPTRRAIERYTGVLYDALDVRTLPVRAVDARLAVGSALFGVVRAADPIPAYRLSAGARLPRLGTLAALWRPVLPDAIAELAAGGLVVDLRSAAYAQLAPVPGAVTVRVLTEAPDGSRSVVSHFNKATKGRLARALVRTKRVLRTPRDVGLVARAVADAVEVDGARVDLVLTGAGRP